MNLESIFRSGAALALSTVALSTVALSTMALSSMASVASAEDTLKLKSGEVLRGNAHDYDEAAKTVLFTLNDGTVRTLKTDDLNRLSAYLIAKSRMEKGNPDDEIKVGNFARTIECYAYAARHYDAAEKADPSRKAEIDAERAENRRQAADYCMRNAAEAKAKGDGREAEKWLKLLIEKLPDEPQAELATAMLSETYTSSHASRDDQYEQDYTELLQGDLKTGKKAYDSMLESIQEGLSNTRQSSKAKKAFESAWKDGEKALKEIDKVQKKRGSDDPKLVEVLDGYRELVREHMIEANSSLASMYTTQTDYQGALAAVNQALALDQGNRMLLAQRARIEQASSDGIRINW